MGGIGTWEVIIVMFIVLMVFGSKRIPEIARGLGRGLAEFRRAARDVQNELTREIEATERKVSAPLSRPVSPEQTAPGPAPQHDPEQRPIWDGGKGIADPPGGDGPATGEAPPEEVA